MKTLLIASHWIPYNNAGTLRWWNFAKYIDLDVLTVKITIGLLDPTFEERGKNVIRISNYSIIAS